ncbi:MarR family winged helix-turn-helix transcriptional regulator [uncultured Thomasclavelia sp.]|uniref:MarR family winged helix-turn-helix transcriptional regulator n=1 Tax=uncultured Thomasclavelia sp. TaxID=3025759 RepID=UPI0025EB50B0|nr:MarR family transcriptional regulator [uncultured Thomasclavelia sp.]
MWPESPCGMMIRQIHLALSRNIDNALRKHNLTLSQLSALMLLTEAPNNELSLKKLEQLLQVSQPNVAGLVLRLEKKKMLEGFTDPNDKRIKRVRINQFGIQCCNEAKYNMANFERQMLQNMSEEEVIVFKELLEKVCNNLI